MKIEKEANRNEKYKRIEKALYEIRLLGPNQSNTKRYVDNVWVSAAYEIAREALKNEK